MKKGKKEKDKNLPTFTQVRSGELIDDGILFDTPKKRYMLSQGVNLEENTLKQKTVMMDFLAALYLALCLTFTVSSFMKDTSSQYIQTPEGTTIKVKNLE